MKKFTTVLLVIFSGFSMRAQIHCYGDSTIPPFVVPPQPPNSYFAWSDSINPYTNYFFQGADSIWKQNVFLFFDSAGQYWFGNSSAAFPLPIPYPYTTASDDSFLIYAQVYGINNTIIASYSFPLVVFYHPVSPTPICLVTADTGNQYVKVIWEPNSGRVLFYHVYRDGNLVGTVNKGELTEFIDSSSSNLTRIYNYYLVTEDSCSLTAAGLNVNNILLQASLGINGVSVNLSWNAYNGPVGNTSQYYILRSFDKGNTFQVLDSLPFGVTYTVYTDNIGHPFPPDSTEYLIRVSDIPACVPSRGAYTSAFSNIRSTAVSSGLEKLNASTALIYPNPANGSIILQGASGEVNIYDVLGQKVHAFIATREFENLNLNLTPGIYFVKLTDTGKTIKFEVR